MVMHARKTQRMSDGYFEKHQTHPYQSSKYSSSKGYGGPNSERYDKFRDSPNGNYRSDSPESQSPRDGRSYQSKSYLQKIREKERENRDYKMSRDKYSELARSPKDKRSRDSDHRTNSDRNDDKSILHPLKGSQQRDRKPMHNNCVDKRDDRDRVAKVGDWSEHVSSSGKKYYYNCKTEVSQWEKPREWIDRERERDRFRGGRDRDRGDDRYRESSSRSSSTRHEKHSNSRGSNGSGSGGSKEPSSRNWNSSGPSAGSSREVPPESSNKESTSEWASSSRRQSNPDISVQSVASSAAQDMDISPGDSTPTSEVSYGANSTQAPIVVEQPVMGPVLLANALPRLSSHQPPSTSAASAAPTLATPPPLLSGATPTVVSGTSPPPMSTSQTAATTSGAPCPLLSSSVSLSTATTDKPEPLTVDTSQTTMGGDGPPTPTHSEGPECGTAKVAVPADSPPAAGGLPPMSSSLQALRPQGPTITPSLANHYRDDLVNHVRGWPAEILEKQANKLAEEAHIMGSIQCSKVSAELKSARSIVRLTEIQATLQEQRRARLSFIRACIDLNWLKFCVKNRFRSETVSYLQEDLDSISKNSTNPDRILFLRQQIKELEELKSQNSFMSDDP